MRAVLRSLLLVAAAWASSTPRPTAAWAPRENITLPEETTQETPEKPTDEVLPPNPGLDAGVGGHWGIQDDSDWVDDRWSLTDFGPFLTSALMTPSGPAHKGLSIRVGPEDAGAVVYDTADMTLRAGWTGGFVRPNPKRFGLIEAPRIVGEVAFAAPKGKAWGGASVRYRGLSLGAARVVLSYEVDGRSVRESPTLRRLDASRVPVFAREIEIGPGEREIVCGLVAVDGARAAVSAGPPRIARVALEGRVTLVSLREAPGLELRGTSAGGIELAAPPTSQVTRTVVRIWSGPEALAGEVLAELRLPPALTDLDEIAAPAVRRWGQPLATQGVVSEKDGPYVIDTLTLPHDNPYRALLFLTGLDFFSDDRVAVSTVHGDVWIVDGVDGDLDHLEWQRFATGLYQPLGLRIVEDRVHVLGRDQITILHDDNDDGEADRYECFSSALTTSLGGHDYNTCLETDAAGNFYYVNPWGVHRISADGSSHETIATGWRNPNGLSVGPDGTITVAPQEGEWTPASQITEVRPGGYYGYGGPRPSAERPLGYDRPLCWIPRHIDNSTGGQVWVTSDRWGPLRGQLLNLSFGRSSMQLVLRERVGDQPQGGLVPLEGRFLSGVVRGRFSPHDGQLYVAGMQGWVTNAIADGCLQRVRYTGAEVRLPVALHAHRNGLRIRLSASPRVDFAEDPASYTIRRWGYRYAAGYGSEEWSVRHPDRIGHDPVVVRSATLLDDGRTIFLELPDIAPVDQMHVHAALETESGEDLSFDLYHTIHRLAPAFDADLAEAPEPTEAFEASLVPGLVLELRSESSRAGESRDARPARLAALRVPADAAPSPFLPAGPFRAAWSGFLRIESRSRVAFAVEGRGRVRLLIDDEVVLDGAVDGATRLESPELLLARGPRPLRLEWRSATKGDAWIRLYRREKGTPTGWETVPATSLARHVTDARLERGARLRHGRTLLARHRCVACHEAPRPLLERGMPELSAAAPSFRGIGDRLTESWMAGWILDPRASRPTATMPALLSPEDVSVAADLAAWLSTLREGAPRSTVELSVDASTAGGELFARLGCIACHTVPSRTTPDLEHGRTSLAGLRGKWRPEALAAFLVSPRSVHPSTAMPDFGSSLEEARRLTAFLLSPTSHVESDAQPTAPPAGDPTRGARIAAEIGCLECHEGPVESRLQAPTLSSLTSVDWRLEGCVADSRDEAPAARYELTPSERAVLQELSREAIDSLWRRDPVETAERLIRDLDCIACHDRDGLGARWTEVEAEAAELRRAPAGRITVQTRPSLTLAGEKLRAEWLERLLSGALERPTRPWLDARMPSFGAQSGWIARGLALGSGYPTETPLSSPPSRELAAAGARLLEAQGGFSCVTCHAVGARPARMELHFGVIDLSLARERLREEFYMRWMLAPQRIDSRTLMPAFADSSGASVLTTVFGGDARRQFAAVWSHLCALEPHATTPLPEAPR